MADELVFEDTAGGMPEIALVGRRFVATYPASNKHTYHLAVRNADGSIRPLCKRQYSEAYWRVSLCTGGRTICGLCHKLLATIERETGEVYGDV